VLFRWREHLKSKKINDVQLALKLQISASALSQWVQGYTFVSLDQLELLRRWYREELISLPPLSEHQLDVAGYCLAMAKIKMKLAKGRGVVEELSPRDFWCLWFFYRNKETRRAWTECRPQLACYIRTIRKRIMLMQVEQVSDVPDSRKLSEEQFAELVKRLVRVWGSAYLAVTLNLDHVFWTGPSQ